MKNAVVSVVAAIVTVGLSSGVQGGNAKIEAPYASRTPVFAPHGMAATSQPLATQIALQILRQGGNAVDAAIAGNAALGLMQPQSNGIGGDLFAIVWDAEKEKLYGLNASGRSPKGLSYSEMKSALGDRNLIPVKGVLPVSVPGTVGGWFKLHGRFGSLPMEELLAPTVRYAREGFPLNTDFNMTGEGDSDDKQYANFLETYAPDGKDLDPGDTFRNPDLADTLETIARDGREAFYDGPIAQTIDRFMRRIGGYLRAEDLASHQSTWVEPVSTTYRGYRVHELPPNGQGIAVLQMLNILEGFDLHEMGHNSPSYLHTLVEAKKLVFEDRARFYADPTMAEVPVKKLISKAYASERRKEIDENKAATDVQAGDPRLHNGDTIYMTVADKEGNMVSLIQSNYYGWGSRLVPDGLGFCLQNRGALFTMEKGHPNVYAPGKRPFHTIIPGFVTKDGEPWLSFGVMGGAMQPQGQVQVLCNLIDFDMNLQEAGDAARFRHTGSTKPTGKPAEEAGGTVHLERGIRQSTAKALRKRGHQLEWGSTFFGGYQGIRRLNTGGYGGASEIRQNGQASGY